jgi:hypothetical protein
LLRGQLAPGAAGTGAAAGRLQDQLAAAAPVVVQ